MTKYEIHYSYINGEPKTVIVSATTFNDLINEFFKHIQFKDPLLMKILHFTKDLTLGENIMVCNKWMQYNPTIKAIRKIEQIYEEKRE